MIKIHKSTESNKSTKLNSIFKKHNEGFFGNTSYDKSPNKFFPPRVQPSTSGVIQRQGNNFNRTPPRYYSDFVNSIATSGLPVNMLRRVGRSYEILTSTSSGEIDHAQPTNDRLVLTPGTVAGLQAFGSTDLGRSAQRSQAIEILYHEATHAFLDLLSYEPRFQQFFQQGERHYANAPLVGGQTSSTPNRLLQEAAGTYVGLRAATWWTTFEELFRFLSRHILTDAQLQRIRRSYDSNMARRTFGYVEPSFWSSRQAETTRAMSAQMKPFLDHELLEDRIPDLFDTVNTFRNMIEDLR